MDLGINENIPMIIIKDLDYKDSYSEICIVFLGFQSCIEKDKSRIDFGVDVLCS